MLILLALLLFAFDRYTGLTKPVRRFLHTLSTPLLYVTEKTPIILHHLADYTTRYSKLVSENQKLRHKNFLLEAKIQRLSAHLKTYKDLQVLWHVQVNLAMDYRVLLARRLLWHVQPMRQLIWVNRGSHDAVYQGQPVLDQHGVIGKVIEVHTYFSLVQLISDMKSAIPVKIARTGEHAIVKGQGQSDTLQLAYISDSQDVKVGDRLLSSGLGLQYLPNYPVGTIVSLTRSANQSFVNIIVKPVAHLKVSDNLLLIWPSNHAI